MRRIPLKLATPRVVAVVLAAIATALLAVALLTVAHTTGSGTAVPTVPRYAGCQ